MQKKFFLLLSATSLISTVHAMNEDLDKTQLTELVSIMKKENKIISPEDSYTKRTTRNLQRCCTSPYEFFELGCCGTKSDFKDAEKEEALIKYVMDQELTINGENILSLDASKTIRSAFEQDQRQQIKEYLSLRKGKDLHPTKEEDGAQCVATCAALAPFPIGLCGASGLAACLTSLCLLPTSIFMYASAKQ